MEVREFPVRRERPKRLWIVLLLLALLFGSRIIASFVIDYEWWKEVGQVGTWTSMLLYGTLPVLAAGLLAFASLWIAHARGLKSAGTGLSEHPIYARISTLLLLVAGWIIAAASIDTWITVRYLGARAAAAAASPWRDPIFGRPLSFYFFELPFYSQLLRYVLAVALISAILHWLSGRIWKLRHRIADMGGEGMIDFRDLHFADAFGSRFFRAILAVFLLGLAIRYMLDRYSLVMNEHRYLVGIDYTNEHVTIPLLWFAAAASVIGAIGILLGQARWLVVWLVAFLLQMFVPGIVAAVYVRPNELAIQKPYISKHIEATRSAYDIQQRVKEMQFPAKLESKVDVDKHRALLDNVRLWDWRAFHDTITQIQALRQYYVFADTDVDRYTLDGRVRQVMLTPRELDVRQLPEARANWINSHFIYTHGYGVVMAEANRINAGGQPSLLIYDAPPKVQTPSLKLTRPEIYFGEKTHEPVFVRTGQPEFNYPSASENVHNQYEGSGGIPISSFPMRVAAAVREGDWNILLTSVLTDQSRMLIHRNVRERLNTLADFIEWDTDPYLVITESGRLTWIVDGYTTSNEHPYARHVAREEFGSINYMRNAVKATVDAYDGSMKLYIFDNEDPIIRAWQAIFPGLFQPASAMPADLRAHVRYPETLFRIQAEIYRTFHMRDPEQFYNNEDLWDVAKNVYGQGGKAEAVTPTFIVGSLPDQDQPEFLLTLPFTPRSKDNLIGVMMARCDADKLGEIVVLQLSKQNLMYGPLQIEARIDSDQNISKDLSLWNQQGSSVLRGQMLTLPVQDTILYIEPIYIQSQQARMPQMKKVVVAMGNQLIYRDTYEQALADLAGTTPATVQAPLQTTAAPARPAEMPKPAPTGQISDQRIGEIRLHLQRYRELSSQGKWAEAGRELEAIDGLVK